MKINELTGVKSMPAFTAAKDVGSHYEPGEPSYTPAHQKSLTDKMKSLGWNLAGSGNYALVYSHPSYNYVLKVFGSDNTHWMKYYNYVRSHQDNPFVFKTRGKIIKLSDTAYAVRMEKLTPLAGKRDPDALKYIDPELQKYDHTDAMSIFDPDNEDFLLENYPQLAEVINAAWKIASSKGDFDLHINNIMKRGDTIVITDPV